MDIERNARAQVLYREVNDHIRELDEAFQSHGQIEVMCECGRGCAERLEVPVDEYDRARRESTHFLVTAPHHASEVDRVIEDHGSWLLVEATGVAAEIARTSYAPQTFGPTMEKHLEGTPLVLRAVDSVIADVEKRDDSSDREEALTLLRELRQKLQSEG